MSSGKIREVTGGQFRELLIPPFLIVGIDEAGRGPLAGPLTAAAVVLPPSYSNDSIVDSKKLSEKKREVLYDEISRCALAYVIVSVDPPEIDEWNIREATRRGMKHAGERLLELLNVSKDAAHFLIDGNMSLATNAHQETIIKGDQKIRSIAAASILAKVSRDRQMLAYEEQFPGYEFARHKGYPTSLHFERLRELGPTPIHRYSFAPVRAAAEQTR